MQQGMEAPGGVVIAQGPPQGEPYDFVANPQVIDHNVLRQRAALFRHQYREQMKMVPQNLMYDRRVVRGNTFGASVIPVAMEPDPAQKEKQLRDELARKRKAEFLRNQREEENLQKAELEQQQRYLYQQQMENPWEELDEGPIEDMGELEPDYFINRPPTAEFIPNPEGVNEAVQVNDSDPDLFDYELEVEPVLQVLIGKALEQSRIEVIEDWEKVELKKHKKAYNQVRQARLIELQRQEAARNRRINEAQILGIQKSTREKLMQIADRKLTARLLAKEILYNANGLMFRNLRENRVIRDDRENVVECQVMPALYDTTRSFVLQRKEQQDLIDKAIATLTFNLSGQHKRAMMEEKQRREEIIKERMRLQREREAEKQRRREERRARREELRVEKLRETISAHIINRATIQELDFNQMYIMDVRTPPMISGQGTPVIYSVGGMLGELILSLSVLLDSILANPQFYEYKLHPSVVIDILRKLLPQLPSGGLLVPCVNKFDTASTSMQKDEKTEDGDKSEIKEEAGEGTQEAKKTEEAEKTEEVKAEPQETEKTEDDKKEESKRNEFMKNFEGPDELGIQEMAYSLLEQDNRAGIGLQFLLSNAMIHALTLNTEIVEALYKAVVEIATRESLPLQEEPEAPAQDAEEEAKKAYEEAKTKVEQNNEGIQKLNGELEELKSKIRIQGKMGQQIYAGSNEAAIVMINPVIDLNLTENITANLEASKINEDEDAGEDEENKEKDEADTTPNPEGQDATQSMTRPQGLRTMLVETRRGALQIIPFHKGVQHAIRDKVIQAAKAVLPEELSDVTVHSLLGSLEERYMELEQRLVQHLQDTMRFEGPKPLPLPCFEFDTASE